MTGGWAWLLWCSAQVRCGAQPGATIARCKKNTPPKDNDGQDKHVLQAHGPSSGRVRWGELVSAAPLRMGHGARPGQPPPCAPGRRLRGSQAPPPRFGSRGHSPPASTSASRRISSRCFASYVCKTPPGFSGRRQVYAGFRTDPPVRFSGIRPRSHSFCSPWGPGKMTVRPNCLAMVSSRANSAATTCSSRLKPSISTAR